MCHHHTWFRAGPGKELLKYFQSVSDVCLFNKSRTHMCKWQLSLGDFGAGAGESCERPHYSLYSDSLTLSELGRGRSSPDELSLSQGFTGGIPGQSVVSGRPAERLVGTVNVKRSARTTPSCALVMATPSTV